ncbi:tail tape measure protein [Desulfocurvibacter africanus]|uniref:Phage tail tape measure protein, TP901 family n=1 Tax=Desulfocurvibacter africanus subsp. africanus str. Walvis Bay TaxID=690850 RepID=F3YW23_DESAF|nr:tail tape measure protein [Desulfocurvibacter africanus]EGJ49053.1 phage tail tape measure protein, TP901 family [Desulfocurvibacter africanus subsp. africanus str. Walvis Bay]
MSNLKTSIILDLAGNLESRAARFAGSLDSMASRGQRSMSMLRGSAEAAGRGLDALGNRYTALLTGAAGVGTAKMVMDLQSRFTRLAIAADISDEQVQKLKKSIYEAAQAPEIRVDPSEITSAIEAIVEKTGDLVFASANIRNIGLAIQATGAQGSAIGEILAEFQKMGVVDPKGVMEALDTLNVQGKAGAFTLRDLAALGPRVVTAYTAMGREGPQALREMGAALQMIRMGTGSSEQSATAFEATMRTLADPAKIKLLKEMAGIDVWEKTEDGGRRLRAINEVMAEIVQKAKGDKVKLNLVFGDEAAKAFNQAASEFQRTGSLESLQKFMAVQGDGTTTMRDSARAARDSSAAMTSLYTAWKQFADSSLTGPIQNLADTLNSIGSETTGKIISGVAVGGAALGAAVLGRKAWNAGRGLFGRGGAAGAADGLGGMPLPLPVYVVNSKMGLAPDQWGGDALGGGRGSRAGRSVASRSGRISRLLGGGGRLGRWVGRGGGALAALAAVPEIWDAWGSDELSTGAKVARTAEAGGSALGGWGGAAAGAAIGSMIFPGVGTVAGGLIGGLAGDWAGRKGAGQVAEWLGGNRDSVTPEALVQELAKALRNSAQGEAPEGRLVLEIQGASARIKSANVRGMGVDVDTGLIMGAY